MTKPQAKSPISDTMRRYAAEIYRLQEDSEHVNLAELASHMDVSAQAASRMASRMRQAGLLQHIPYRGVRLTDEGEQAAMPAIRRHRLIEVFLVKVMGFDWSEIHDLAETFELGVDQALEDRIDRMTGSPKRCPHGDPIPSKDGRMPKLADFSLSELASGAEGVISRIRTHDPAKLTYLAAIGLVPGVAFDVQSCAPFNGPLRLRYQDHDEVLGYELASSIWVEAATA